MAADALREVLGTEPPAAVQELPADARAELVRLIEAARRAQAAELEKAFDGVLRQVPFAVRPIARKLLRG